MELQKKTESKIESKNRKEGNTRNKCKTHNKMVDLNLTITVLILNVNVFNNPMKR